MTALHVAAMHGQSEFAREIIIRVPVNIRTQQSKTNGSEPSSQQDVSICCD